VAPPLPVITQPSSTEFRLANGGRLIGIGAAPQEGYYLRQDQAVGGRGVTPEQRRLRAQLAANTRWSRPMSREDRADAARAAMRQRLEREVDRRPAGGRDQLILVGLTNAPCRR
jgi:hypothetical protein